jgi:NhaC family Na+:H+ antiporter
VLSPTLFLFAACIISAIVSTATGSSWTTVATVGVALLGIGKALGFEEGIIAGAIISGAYFGDKMSPLSDTTNLAPAMAGTDLFTHIRHMAKTTIPTMVITLILFFVIGLNYQTDGNVEDVKTISTIISSTFTLTPWLFLVPAVVIFMIIKKVPALPALLVGALLGGVFALIFQPQ